jgi:putative hemolysin
MFGHLLPDIVIEDGAYAVSFARTASDVEALGRLRFDVFNLELGEGFEASYASGIDEDEFDRVCHHLMLYERATGTVVGTYRLLTREMAEQSGQGFYSAVEFDLSAVPGAVLSESVEIGRACIARAHRSLQVLYLLWRGLGAYMSFNRQRYLFGCCSLTSQDLAEGRQVMQFLEENGHIHPAITVQPHPAYRCYEATPGLPESGRPKVPRLMRVYLGMGAKICGPPAIDRAFKTIDYFTFFDADILTEQSQAYLMYQRGRG